MKRQVNGSKIPVSVYRLQLNEDFPLKAATSVIAYLHNLGIEGVYCSPIFEAESSHGYDVVNPHALGTGLGTREDYEAFCSELKKYEMKQIIDIVPNHMGVKKNKNVWWIDVLEKGQASPYADYFDIDWRPGKEAIEGKILLPLLGDVYGKCLEEGQIELRWQDGGFWLVYGDYHLPVSLKTYSFILNYPLSEEFNTPSLEKCRQLSRELANQEGSQALQESLKKEIADLIHGEDLLKKWIEELLLIFNGKKGQCASFDLLHELLQRQHYYLAHWILGGQEINYRRFFNINELVGIHIENEKVLQDHHSWIFDLIETGQVQGLRVDHPDGLYDPAQYFERLQAKNPGLVVAEKILAFNEDLPTDFEIDGTVGYEFLNLLCGLFIFKNHQRNFERIYEKFIGETKDPIELLYRQKKWFIRLNMGSEISSLGWRLDRLTEKNRFTRDFARTHQIEALKEIVACFPVYRTYIRPDRPVSNQDRDFVNTAVERAQRRTPEIDSSIYDFIKMLLLQDLPDLPQSQKNEAADILQRFQQLTGPVMAKGLEDSCFYLYNRFIALNEVGGSLQYFGHSKSDFHQFNRKKLENWPLGFLTATTHDTKFSEDTRMRLSVISELPQKWQELVQEWKNSNQKYKQPINGQLFPEFNSEYYLYQILVGIWPEGEIDVAFKERLWNLWLKILRESDVHTNWRKPSAEYEKIAKSFLESILTQHPENRFLEQIQAFAREVAYFGRLNTLSALTLRMGSCGIVDVYQGDECWNFALLDPDNRRPVDYAKHISLLNQMPTDPSPEFLANLLENLPEDKSKTYFVRQALHLRLERKELFLEGSTYIPLTVQGPKKDHVIAFMRMHGDEVALSVAARFFTKLDAFNQPDLWSETVLVLPKSTPLREFVDVYTQKTINVHKSKLKFEISLQEIFQHFPCALLVSKKTK